VHNTILNCVQRERDGAWRTLDSAGLYRERGAAAAVAALVMESALARDLGVEFTERKKEQDRLRATRSSHDYGSRLPRGSARSVGASSKRHALAVDACTGAVVWQVVRRGRSAGRIELEEAKAVTIGHASSPGGFMAATQSSPMSTA
jgi:hypothetical protein